MANVNTSSTRNIGASSRLGLGGLVAFIVMCLVPVDADNQQTQTTTMAHRYRVPLSRQVSCVKNETIRFPRELHHLTAFDREPTAEEYANWMIEISDIGIIMVVDNVTSFLIENESWISTRLSGFVEEVLFSKKRKRVEYSPPIIEIPDAGEMTVNGGHVIAGNYDSVTKGQRYLLFLQEDEATSSAITTTPPVRVGENGVLHSPSIKWLHGAALDMVRRRVRLAVH
jgi:hypothetical protein